MGKHRLVIIVGRDAIAAEDMESKFPEYLQEHLGHLWKNLPMKYIIVQIFRSENVAKSYQFSTFVSGKINGLALRSL